MVYVVLIYGSNTKLSLMSKLMCMRERRRDTTVIYGTGLHKELCSNRFTEQSNRSRVRLAVSHPPRDPCAYQSSQNESVDFRRAHA
jgi:hypothetical protein